MKLKLSIFALALFILSGFVFQSYDQIVTRVLIVQNRAEIRTNAVFTNPSTAATATPGLLLNNSGAGKALEIQDAGTPIWSVLDGGAVRGYVVSAATPEKLENCWSSTITGTGSYTSLTTAISTPEFAWCNISGISADALNCGAAVGQGIVTITVRNSAATPAANAAGATVFSCAKGTP